MKISEKLSELKQKECEMMRLFDLKETVMQQSFENSISFNKDKLTEAALEKKKKEFAIKQAARVADIDKKVSVLMTDILAGKNQINKKNVEMGIDKKLIEIKYIRLELSKLMKLVKREHAWERVGISLETYDSLDLSKKIKALENRKSKLDSEIQHVNWNTNL